MKPLSYILDDGGGSAPTSVRRIRQDRLRATIRQLRQLLVDVLGPGNDRSLVEALNALGRDRLKLQRAFVVWIDLIEVLVQDAEMRYGTAPGRGPVKASDVKAVMRYLLRTGDFDIPSVPRFVEDAIVEIAVDWTVDAVVLVLNENGYLWIASDPAPQTFRARLRILGQKILDLTRPLWLSVAALLIRVWRFVQYRPPLSPQLRAAADAVRREGLIDDADDIITAVVSGIVWLGNHREQVVGTFELVVAAVQEAEYVGSLRGQEKKVYARDLIFAVLAELGFYVRSGLPFALVDAMIDAAIEAAVHLFHKHDVFT